MTDFEIGDKLMCSFETSSNSPVAIVMEKFAGYASGEEHNYNASEEIFKKGPYYVVQFTPEYDPYCQKYLNSQDFMDLRYKLWVETPPPKCWVATLRDMNNVVNMALITYKDTAGTEEEFRQKIANRFGWIVEEEPS